MNYTTITIEGNKIGLKFGMASFRYLQGKFVDGISYEQDQLNEIGIAHIIYSGYYNNCIIKEQEPKLSFSDIVDFIEINLNNVEVLEEIKNVIQVWSENDFIKSSQINKEEPKKKTTRSKK
jgi:hypothetical protein